MISDAVNGNFQGEHEQFISQVKSKLKVRLCELYNERKENIERKARELPENKHLAPDELIAYVDLLQRIDILEKTEIHGSRLDKLRNHVEHDSPHGVNNPASHIEKKARDVKIIMEFFTKVIRESNDRVTRDNFENAIEKENSKKGKPSTLLEVMRSIIPDLHLCPPSSTKRCRGKGRLAQLVEHLVYTEEVGSSSLSPPTQFRAFG